MLLCSGNRPGLSPPKLVVFLKLNLRGVEATVHQNADS